MCVYFLGILLKCLSNKRLHLSSTGAVGLLDIVAVGKFGPHNEPA